MDANFANFDNEMAEFEPSTVNSHTGYVVLHGGCLMVWALKLQKETTLLTTEAKCGA